MKVTKKCHRCHKAFQIGYTGVMDATNKPVCDKCSGIQRDDNGFPWFPDEKEKTFYGMSTDGRNHYTFSVVTREQAFNQEVK